MSFKVNGQEVDFDFYDAENAKKYECACQSLQSDRTRVKKDAALSDVICAQYQMATKFFDALLGTGVGDRLLGGQKNLKVIMQCMSDFAEGIKQQKDEIDALTQRTADLLKV